VTYNGAAPGKTDAVCRSLWAVATVCDFVARASCYAESNGRVRPEAVGRCRDVLPVSGKATKRFANQILEK
jgi:hypothetical protein